MMPLKRRLTAMAGDESGFTLLELVVSAVMSIIALTIIGSLFFNTFTVQNRVTNNTSRTSAGQQVISEIEKNLRSTSVLTLASDSDGSLLLAQTTNAAGVTSCGYRAYYFAYASPGAIYTKTSTSTITKPNAAALKSSWKLMIDKVGRYGSEVPFVLGTGASAGVVTIHFSITVPKARSIELRSSAVSRLTKLETSQC